MCRPGLLWVEAGPVAVGGGASHHLVQPADRGALARVAERFQFVVPGLAQELGDLGREVGLSALSTRQRGAQAVLGDQDVAVDAGDGVEDTEVGGCSCSARPRRWGRARRGPRSAADANRAARRRAGGGAGLALPGEPERQVPGAAGCRIQSRLTRVPSTPATAHSTWHSARGASARTELHVSSPEPPGRAGYLADWLAEWRDGRVDGEATLRRGKECDVPSVPVPGNRRHSPRGTLVGVRRSRGRTGNPRTFLGGSADRRTRGTPGMPGSEATVCGRSRVVAAVVLGAAGCAGGTARRRPRAPSAPRPGRPCGTAARTPSPRWATPSPAGTRARCCRTAPRCRGRRAATPGWTQLGGAGCSG